MVDGSTRLSLRQNLVASGSAVVAATMVTHPIDVVKVRLQVVNRGNAKADAFSISRFFSFWPELYRREGIGVFYSGLAAASWRAATYGAARIGLCDPMESLLGSRAVGALSAGVLATVLGNPFEVLKVRLQAKPGTSNQVFGALRAMIRDEGLMVLGRGFQWAALRSSLLTASQVVPYDKAKSALRATIMRDGLLCHVTASLIAGLVTTTVTAPIDLLKTRVMNASAGSKLGGPMAMLANEGAFVFFRGWLANYVRIGPQTLFIFVFYERAKILVRHFGG